MTIAENPNQMPNEDEDEIEALKTKLLTTDTRLQLTATELKTTQVELQKTDTELKMTQSELKVTKQELQTAKKNHADLDASLVASVTSFARPTAPDGWLLCDGKAVSRSVYARLFQAIGTIYGKGDGSTTFNLPDMRGLFVRGHDPEGKNDLKREFGSYQGDQIQSHSHSDSGHNHSGNIGAEGNHSHSGSTGAGGSHSHSGSASSDGRHDHKFGETNGESFSVTGFYSNYNSDASKNYGYVGKILLGYKELSGKYWRCDGFPDYRTWTEYNGEHSHSLSINSADSHTHSVNVNSAGSHSHSVSINNGQANLSNPTNARHGSETTVKNLALIYCIKY